MWLQYPVMVIGAAKLLFEDFPKGHPTALAISLLFFGGTLILLPRFRDAKESVNNAPELVSKRVD